MHHFKFCPECGGALEKKHVHRNEPEEKRLVCRECGFVFWQNPKPTASAIIEDESGRVLLVRRVEDISVAAGMWDIPGGFVEVGEHPEEAVRREVREETGLTIEPQELLTIVMDTYGEGDRVQSTMNIGYLCRIVSGTPEASSDVAETRWFTVGALPDEMAFYNNKVFLNAWLEWRGRNRKHTQLDRDGA